MFGRSQIVHFAAFLALLSPALATVYRLDDRSPQTVKDAGGLVSWNPAGTGSVIQHVRKELGDQDPWVSTSTDKKLLRKGATSITDIFLYEISEDGLDLVDTKEAFKEAGEEHPHPGEEEFSVKGKIPWENIKKWTVYKRSKKQSDQTRKDFDDGQKDKRSDPLVRSVKFRV